MNTLTLPRAPSLRAAIDAALVMAIGMGFGRFAFTAIYPHMLEEGRITLTQGGWAASANYAGYLLGAIVGMRAQAHNAHRMCLWSVLGTAFCLAFLAVLQSPAMLILIRLVAGVFSALAMIAASLWLLEHRRQASQAPLLYAGVGVGIAASAELLAAGSWAGLHSCGLWLLLGGVSVLIVAELKPWPLVLLYGLAGFGYIVTATYLPTLVKAALPGLDASHVWAVFGLGAAPSCFLWHHLHQRHGTRKALFVNLGVQALGVVLPVFLPGVTGYLLSAVLVGGTFTGTVTIAMPAAQRLARSTGIRLVAIMTLVYGIGQIAGPLVASTFYGYSHSFSPSLLAAAGALGLAGLISRYAL
ncbi:YbfB/YjiJ family MFS transporter [Duganella callida]|uniref:YbfB/YjiJ family MFS transporter n=1 Tax=Duganella callida TaxID=2561932 RepID=A0A4Y9SF98_9BURK|nr:YbfB/YjiJ family MFS transporter [Duganella callida]TFW19515.1 YbfB/YjiJ family MFS transporter [Duganella callida]